MSQSYEELLDRAAAVLKTARLPIALTGAGISVPSGIPDFRSPGGLWSKYDPQRVASIDALHRTPLDVWEFVMDAALTFDGARPNPAHDALARLEEGGRLSAIITQNIDNLHTAAGSSKVIEFHGNCLRFYCMDCGAEHDPARVRELRRDDLPWRCDGCSGVVRPDFVFFGEMIPERALRETMLYAGEADVCLIVGTSGEVAPANSIPRQVKAAGGTVIEVNIGGTLFDGVTDIRFDAPAEKVLPALAERVLS